MSRGILPEGMQHVFLAFRKNIAEGCAEYGNLRRYASYRQTGKAAARLGIAVCPETSRQPIWFFGNQIAPMDKDKDKGHGLWSRTRKGKGKGQTGETPRLSCPFLRACSASPRACLGGVFSALTALWILQRPHRGAVQNAIVHDRSMGHCTIWMPADFCLAGQKIRSPIQTR